MISCNGFLLIGVGVGTNSSSIALLFEDEPNPHALAEDTGTDKRTQNVFATEIFMLNSMNQIGVN